MPDSDLDKPGLSAPAPSAGHKDAARNLPGQQADGSIGDELDRLLLEIDVAVEELDPTGDLEETASRARSDAVAGDRDHDEVEDMFEVVVPAGSGSPQSDEAVPADSAAGEVDEQLDALIDQAQGGELQTVAGQIDQELDALLNEAQSLLEPEPAAAAGTPDDVPVEASAATADPEGIVETLDVSFIEPEPVAETETEEMVVEQPSPVGEDSTATTRTIEDLDADLASRAENALEAQAAGEADDAFRSSEDVVEEVIEELASVREDLPDAAESEQEATDELAQLMAESPASSDLGVGSKPRAGAPAGAAGSNAEHKPKVAASSGAADPAVRAEKKLVARISAIGSIVMQRARPAAVSVARVLSKPLELVPPRVRDDIGWLASVTLFLAFAVLIALALFR